MQRIVVDKSLGLQLESLMSTAELCDASGKVLARVQPVRMATQYDELEPQISDEELDLREHETKEYTTAEVLAHLRNLENR